MSWYVIGAISYQGWQHIISGKNALAGNKISNLLLGYENTSKYISS